MRVGAVGVIDAFEVVIFQPHLDPALTTIGLDTPDGRRHELDADDALARTTAGRGGAGSRARGGGAGDCRGPLFRFGMSSSRLEHPPHGVSYEHVYP